MQRIGILGGMFDPIHMGHINAALSALHWGLDRVLLSPCQAPVHRPKALVSARHRLQMCRIAALAHPGLEATDIELREGPCYAADTIALLSQRYPGAQLFWIIGADKLPSLQHWHNAEYLFDHCEFLVCPRSGYDMLMPPTGTKMHMLDAAPLQVSSGEIVQRLQAYDDAQEALARDIARYIAENGLYQPDLVPVLMQYGMQEHRLQHTLGVRKEAVRLAYLHGENMQAAGVAAMLHDIAKPLPLEEMQRLARQYALDLPDEVLADGNLLHGPVAAAIAQHELHIADARILSAIACHTSGKCGMSTLDLCVFLADAIEENRRNYPGLADMRRLSDTDLAGAVLLSMQRTREYVLSQGRHFCSQTEKAIQDLLNRRLCHE